MVQSCSCSFRFRPMIVMLSAHYRRSENTVIQLVFPPHAAFAADRLMAVQAALLHCVCLCMSPAAYIANPRSMYKTVYQACFWTMTKEGPRPGEGVHPIFTGHHVPAAPPAPAPAASQASPVAHGHAHGAGTQARVQGAQGQPQPSPPSPPASP